MPDPRLVAPRTDSGAADMQSLVQLGYAPPQPPPGVPAPAPAPPPPVSDPADEQEEAALTEALAEAGVTATAEDQAAVQALAKLDAATVQAVTRWMRTKKTRPETGTSK